MKRYVSRAAGLAVLCGLVMGVAACGGSDSSGDSGSGETREAGKPTVAIGVVGTFTGISGAAEVAPDVMEAWAKTVNDAGGINGQDVRIIVKDVGTGTGRGRAAVQELIADDHVAAIISQDLNDATWARYAEEQSVPMIPAQISVTPYMSANAFPITQSPITLSYAIGSEFKTAGGVGAIGYPAELAAAAQIADQIKQFAGELDVELPVVSKMSSSAPDYTAFCQQMKQAGVKAYLVAFAADVSDKITEQCVAQRAGGARVLQGFGAEPEWRRNPMYDGSVVIDGVAPFFDESVPGIARYRAALERYAPEVPGSRFDNATVLLNWAAAEMIAAAGAKVDGEITNRSLQRALYTMSDETLDGLIAPVTYTEGRTSAVRCWFTWRVSGGEFVTTDDEPECAPEAAVAQAEANLVRSLGG